MPLPFLVIGSCHVIVGERSFIRHFFPFKELEITFEGYLEGRTPTDLYLGVWCHRTCSRFRRLLQERGAEFTIIESLPHDEFKIVGQRTLRARARQSQ